MLKSCFVIGVFETKIFFPQREIEWKWNSEKNVKNVAGITRRKFHAEFTSAELADKLSAMPDRGK